MSFEIGDEVQLQTAGGWYRYGVVRDVKRSFGSPDINLIEWKGDIQPDRARVTCPSNLKTSDRTELVYSCSELTPLESKEWFQFE